MMRIKDVTDDFVTVEVRETLVPQDYSIVMPELVRLSEKSQGDFNVLVELLDFRGWEPPELGKQARFGAAPLGAAARRRLAAYEGARYRERRVYVRRSCGRRVAAIAYVPGRSRGEKGPETAMAGTSPAICREPKCRRTALLRAR